MIRAVVDEQLVGVIIMPPSVAWLYHPYDGGVDVIAETIAARAALRNRFRDWLSHHPRGL